MKLTSFQITNFRSINDSGWVTAAKITSIVGRNESGKSNLLLGLRTLNPPGGAKDLKPIKDFPRHRRLTECTDDTPVVATLWELEATEQAELAKIFPRAASITHVQIGRRYKAERRWVAFPDLKDINFAISEVAIRVRKIQPAIEADADKLEDGPKQQTIDAIQKLATDLATPSTAVAWAAVAAPQGCSTLSTDAPFEKSIESGESGGISVLTESAGLVAAQDVVAKTAYASEDAGVETDARLVLQKGDVAGVVELVLDVPVASDRGACLARRCGEIRQIVSAFGGAVPQAGLGTAMPNFAIDAHDGCDQRLPLGAGNRAGGAEYVDGSGFLPIACRGRRDVAAGGRL
jgi:hypothetical protein